VVAAALFVRYLHSHSATTTPDGTLLAKLDESIVRVLNVGALSAQERAFLGRTLSGLGDSRGGVGLDAAGTPDIAWSATIPVSGTAVAHGGPSGVEISMYAVTNRQYRAFLLADDGYGDDRWWTQPGLEWNLRLGAPPEISGDEWSQNCPCTSVSWYDADAFTRWLSSKLATEVRLPGSTEWQAAARGPEMLKFPYGDQFDEHANNTATAGLFHPCAVGIFPRGRSPYGLFDLGGNVFEWTSTPWPGTNSAVPEPSYIVCGAAYDSRDTECIRSAHCFPRRPASRVPQRGFRLARTV
jgi:formylglycine-generating enzyme required for sulfatase activity